MGRLGGRFVRNLLLDVLDFGARLGIFLCPLAVLGRLLLNVLRKHQVLAGVRSSAELAWGGPHVGEELAVCKAVEPTDEVADLLTVPLAQFPASSSS